MTIGQVVALVGLHHDVIGRKKHEANQLLEQKKAMPTIDVLQYELS